MHPMRAGSFQPGPKRSANQKGVSKFFNQSQPRNHLNGCTSSPSTRKYHAFVVVLIFNAVGITLKQDTFTTDMSKLAANFGEGKQFNKLTSNSTNVCRPEKETLLCLVLYTLIESEREFFPTVHFFLIQAHFT